MPTTKTTETNQHIVPPIEFKRSLTWLAILLLVGSLLFLFSSILLPFVLGILIAYILNPFIEPFEGIGAPRWLSAIGLLTLFFLVTSLGFLIITPIISREIADLARNTPQYYETLQAFLQPYLQKLTPYIGDVTSETVTQKLKDNAQAAFGFSSAFLGKILHGTNMFIGFVTALFLTPIVAFYMMAEWPSFTRKMKDLIPMNSRNTILGLLKEMDLSIAGFLRGQFLVCIFLGLFYGISLTMLGLKYGFIIGLLSGILSFIPFVGSAFGFVAGLSIATFQFGTIDMIGLTCLIFVIGQILEGNILTPKLVGESINLHPLWIIFSIMAGGSLMGFTGMLIALPVAAVLGVLIRFGIARYKDSEFYKHHDANARAVGASKDKKTKATKKTAKKTTPKKLAKS